ncbi:hypothetical protein K2X30_14515 [bacterium]|nr:hypothetical protein [bacterium]
MLNTWLETAVVVLVGGIVFALLHRVNKKYRVPTAIGLGVWLLYSGAMAAFGLLLDFDSMPPPMFRVVVPGIVGVTAIAFSKLGTRIVKDLSYVELIGFQSFRIPVELILLGLMHAGTIPIQMTFEGRNGDILTGISALFVAYAVRKKPKRGLIWAWNIFGLALLVNIVTVAILSMPGRTRTFMNEPPNLAVFSFPYVWIPAVFVMLALFGHLLVFRKLLGPK